VVCEHQLKAGTRSTQQGRGSDKWSHLLGVTQCSSRKASWVLERAMGSRKVNPFMGSCLSSGLGGDGGLWEESWGGGAKRLRRRGDGESQIGKEDERGTAEIQSSGGNGTGKDRAQAATSWASFCCLQGGCFWPGQQRPGLDLSNWKCRSNSWHRGNLWQQHIYEGHIRH
jgi:hypothetical protein